MNFKDSILEILAIVKTCLTTVWFWIPVLFGVYIWAQLGIMFYIHPLALAIAPSILIIYALIQESKRIRLQYGLGKEGPAKTEVNVKRIVNEYELLLKNEKKSQE